MKNLLKYFKINKTQNRSPKTFSTQIYNNNKKTKTKIQKKKHFRNGFVYKRKAFAIKEERDNRGK